MPMLGKETVLLGGWGEEENSFELKEWIEFCTSTACSPYQHFDYKIFHNKEKQIWRPESKIVANITKNCEARTCFRPPVSVQDWAFISFALQFLTDFTAIRSFYIQVVSRLSSFASVYQLINLRLPSSTNADTFL